MSTVKSYDAAGRELLKEYGELLERGRQDADLSPYKPYEADPVGFVREILGEEPWSLQVEVMESVRDNRKTAVPGCNALGKDWTATRLLAWWAYAVGGTAVVTAPTERQLHEIIMRKELAHAKRAGNLPGSLYTEALRIRGDEASVIAKTATAAAALSGFHDERVLAVITEAQGVDEHAWRALGGVATGDGDRILAVGNPLVAEGRFYQVAS